MSQYMVEFALPEFTEEFVAKIPLQRIKILNLLEIGKIDAYAVSADRSKMWCIINAKDESEVLQIIAEFPLRDYLKPNIMELLFHNAVLMKIPSFSLN